MTTDGTSFEIKIKDSDEFKDVEIRDLTSDLFYGLSGKFVATNYGFFFISFLSYDPDKLLEYSKGYLTRKENAELKKEYVSFFKLKEHQLLHDVGGIDMSHALVDKIGEATILKILSDHQDIWNSGFAHVWLWTKDLLDFVHWGEYRRIDGYLTSLRKLYKILEAFEIWDASSGAEILLDWGWRDLNGEFVSGFNIDMRFLDVQPDETLEQLEKKIDDGIQQIKEYLKFEPKVGVSHLFTVSKCEFAR